MTQNNLTKFVPKSKREIGWLERIARARGSTDPVALENRRREWGNIAASIQEAAGGLEKALAEKKAMPEEERTSLESAKLGLLYQLATLEAMLGVFDALTVRIRAKSRTTGQTRDVRVTTAQCLYDILCSAEDETEEDEEPAPPAPTQPKPVQAKQP